jgi:hypothetical protein
MSRIGHGSIPVLFQKIELRYTGAGTLTVVIYVNGLTSRLNHILPKPLSEITSNKL